MTSPSYLQPGLENVTPRYAELSNQVAVVTGAAKGIGQGIAFRLAAEGMRLVAADIDDHALAHTTAMLEERGADVLPFHGDVGRADDIAKLFADTMARWSGVDLLVNNAADLKLGRLLDEHDELLERQLAVNLRGPYLCSQRAAAIMRDAGGGSIVHISSVGAAQAHHRGLPYDVTKGAINSLTRAMAVDLGEYGIRVNAVGPGLTHTYRTDANPDPERYRAKAARVPLGRHGTVADIAAMVAFLASEEAGYITGQVIYVDGGITAQLSPPGAPV